MTRLLLLKVFMLILILCSSGKTQDFDIGVYYIYNKSEGGTYPWNYNLMDMARSGCTQIFVNDWTQDNYFWQAVKNWNLKAVVAMYVSTSDTTIDINAMRDQVVSTKQALDNLYAGDNIYAYYIYDEPECQNLTETQQNKIRAFADTIHQYDPDRKVIVNHCDPTWYDLHEDMAWCSAAPTIEKNQTRILERTAAAKSIGLDGFTVVALPTRASDWMAGRCDRIYWVGFATTSCDCSSQCMTDTINWLASRTNYEDIVEEVETAYKNGSMGYMVYQFNPDTQYSLTDSNGNDKDFRWQGLGDGARSVRELQGWPKVSLFRRISATSLVSLNDLRNYPAGSVTFQTKVSQGVTKVVFGKSVDNGATWQNVEVLTTPYKATFMFTAGQTAIIRAQGIDINGNKSVYAANMMKFVDPSVLQCGDYESAMLDSDINKDCVVDLADFALLASDYLHCDNPGNPICGTSDKWHQFICNQSGGNYPGMKADVNSDCYVNFEDVQLLVTSWLNCDSPTNCF